LVWFFKVISNPYNRIFHRIGSKKAHYRWLMHALKIRSSFIKIKGVTIIVTPFKILKRIY